MAQLQGLVGWGFSLVDEAVRLPTTLARARKVVAVLPDHLETLVDSLERLHVSLDALARELHETREVIDGAMPPLSDAVLRLDDRVERMDGLLGELGGTVVGTLNAVPGLRRTVARRGQTRE